ncbi:hypothetical protein DL98DRAFT_511547 [Cadophora sp. DSE1049]|nr:hypothetical protein DL98DRAFT_511547 [Cadophora sp. DSE1049]
MRGSLSWSLAPKAFCSALVCPELEPRGIYCVCLSGLVKSTRPVLAETNKSQILMGLSKAPIRLLPVHPTQSPSPARVSSLPATTFIRTSAVEVVVEHRFSGDLFMNPKFLASYSHF